MEERRKYQQNSMGRVLERNKNHLCQYYRLSSSGHWGSTMEPVSLNSLWLRLEGELTVSTFHCLKSANPSSEPIFWHGVFHNHLYGRLRPLASSTLIALWKPGMWMFTVVMEPPHEVKTHTPITVTFQTGLNYIRKMEMLNNVISKNQ